MKEQIESLLKDYEYEPNDRYRELAETHLSSHALIDFIRCPALYRRKRDGLIPSYDSAALLEGRAAHTMILEGEKEFLDEYAVGGPINPNTNKPYGHDTKAWREYEKKCGKVILSGPQATRVYRMAEGVKANKLAREMLKNGRPEVVVRSECVVGSRQIRIDWLSPEHGIVDLKTCESLTKFQWNARDFRYHNQAAFYQEGLAAAIGLYVPFHFIVVEKKEPFRCGVWEVSDNTMALALDENKRAMAELADCMNDRVWPTRYEKKRILEIN